MVGSFALLLLTHALAAGPSHIGDAPPMKLEEYVSDLTADRRSDRLFAVRELRRRARHAERVSQSTPGTLRQLEARHELAFFAREVAPRCIEELNHYAELRAPCSEILGILESSASLPALQEARRLETRRWALRRIEYSITRIQASEAVSP